MKLMFKEQTQKIISFDSTGSIEKNVVKNPFANLYDMVQYFLTIADSHDLDQLEAFADWQFSQHKDKCTIGEIFDESAKEQLLVDSLMDGITPPSNDWWMNFDEEKLNALLLNPFFQEYHDTIYYEGKDLSLFNGTSLIKGGRKYSYLELYTLAKLESIAICNLPNNKLSMLWYDWFYKDHILDFIWNFNWYNIIADVYIKKGKNWFYDTATYYPSLGLDACMYKWACYGILACHKTQKVPSKTLKNDLTDLYTELLITSTRANAIEKNNDVLEHIKNAINNFDDENFLHLNQELESLKHENQTLLDDKITMEKTMATLRTEIAKLEQDSTRTDDEKAESIVRKIYAMMPDETGELKKSEHDFSVAWDKFSDETKKDINRSVRFFEDMESVDVALFLMIRNVEREFDRHFFTPFKQSALFNNVRKANCFAKKYSKTHDALKDLENHPTMGNIPFIGRALKDKAALQSSEIISAFHNFLGGTVNNFCDICRSIQNYRVGLSQKKIVDIRNIFAHGNVEKHNEYDKSSYEDGTKFLYEPPLQVLFKIALNSKQKRS